MFEPSTEIILFLLAAAFIAGFVDSIAGGGGLITVPALLLAGVPPVTALATNKVQGLFGAGMAAINYARAGHVNLLRQLKPAVLSFAAALFGALSVNALPTDLIRWVLPVLLVAIALFFALKPGLDDTDRQQRLPPAVFALTFVPLIGFYDGLLGPGTGAFFMLAYVAMAGHGILKATAHTKLLNFASNVGALLGFLIVLSPLWVIGLAMGAAQLAGAYLGSNLASRIGAKLIKPLLVFASTAMALKLITDLL
ncbi:TSUP family transporter [Aliiroseovarius sediminis]|uniref:TSUP family transporter n=1 Tax=Aliiroseovarius sediminis TaxID=2925839 RepID=UPI001F59D690|nr:TSUP family transporter [uncultured Aliiroseovarius sp.]MCI2395369.1 TSUP family transporter [Aliiroseovarius sediminis]